MRVRSVGLCVSVVCFLGMFLAVSSVVHSAAQPQGPINLGLITSLTGPASHVAKEQVNGGELAVKEINEAGGVLGRKVALQVRDDQLRPDIGLRQFEELIQEQKIVALFGAVSGAVNVAVSGKAKEYRIPLAGVTQIRTYQVPGKQPYHWGFMSDASAGFAGADFVAKNLGKKQYILYLDT
ncbi:MAG: ABC transporter substrate-binding protein, partial [Syntrophorhabdales bacterium]